MPSDDVAEVIEHVSCCKSFCLATIPRLNHLALLLTCLFDVEYSDIVTEDEIHGYQATSRGKGSTVHISPVKDNNLLQNIRAEFNAL